MLQTETEGDTTVDASMLSPEAEPEIAEEADVEAEMDVEAATPTKGQKRRKKKEKTPKEPKELVSYI